MSEDDFLQARRYRNVISYCGIADGQLMDYINALHNSLEQERLTVMKQREKLDALPELEKDGLKLREMYEKYGENFEEECIHTVSGDRENFWSAMDLLNDVKELLDQGLSDLKGKD
jgi:hypothetical protein